ncbi:hypothetical protein GCM10009007_08420 [Formosimonas limnophila]|uniref:Holin n=1 Tax=Formosimonas limnophila TaxID=1384487 RepID=A0A8J3FZ05_9BURK|nr:hypothetical protein [Formosimonas limnophila]GHA70089.1 hypothetical protein GCM10009007_08420 [Formosimonas limnophila]
MLIIRILSTLALIGSILWFTKMPDYEPAIAIVTSITALIAAWYKGQKPEQQATQRQGVAENGVGIQAGGNITIGEISLGQKAKDAE